MRKPRIQKPLIELSARETKFIFENVEKKPLELSSSLMAMFAEDKTIEEILLN